ENRIALWDVIGECEIEGSADSTIKNVRANDIRLILNAAPVEKIFVNGKTAEKYYNRYILPLTGIKAICLPSTSPANAAKSIDALIEEWKIILA
ncbi:MAG: DNA-deoxyinosine glycosylase, partial [Clostridia bacterium]|nr:DNA-deoxyinosine glycosylase [Clostridia bacterium]